MSGLQKSKVKTQSRQYRQSVWRPKSSVAKSSVKCPHCGNPCEAQWAICPECGHSLHPDVCTFCGAQVDAEKRFCNRCGQPKDGVVCPECGTLNSRNFCRKCNAPLTPRGHAARSAALADPMFQTVSRKAAELEALYRQIEEYQKNAPAHSELSAEDKALLDRYNSLFNSTGTPDLYKPPVVAQRQQYHAPELTLDAIMDAYREKAAEMDAALAALTPPPDFTPEQQRDYYSARKVACVDVQYDMTNYNPMMWRCNVCSALHPDPSDCVSPELGGQWIYITPEQYNDELGGLNITKTTLKIE